MVPGILSLDCMGSGIPSSNLITSGILNPERKVSGIPSLDLRIPESYQKYGIPVSIPKVVQHCLQHIAVRYGKHMQCITSRCPEWWNDHACYVEIFGLFHSRNRRGAMVPSLDQAKSLNTHLLRGFLVCRNPAHSLQRVWRKGVGLFL